MRTKTLAIATAMLATAGIAAAKTAVSPAVAQAPAFATLTPGDLPPATNRLVPRPQRPSAFSTRIVVPGDDGLWLVDAQTGMARRVTSRRSGWFEAPRFYDGDRVSVQIYNKVGLINLQTGAFSLLAAMPASSVESYAISPDKRRIAVLTTEPVKDGSVPAVTVFTDGKRGVTRRLSGFVPDDSCGADDHESRVAYSPDGAYLMAVDTQFEQTHSTMFLLDPSGTALERPFYGALATWLPSGHELWYRTYDTMKWYSLDAATGARSRLALRPKAHRLAFSPDGASVAYDDADGVTTFVRSLRDGSERVLGSGFVGPIWLAPDRVAATAAKSCAECDPFEPWTLPGYAMVIGPRPDRAPMSTTFGADVAYAPARTF